MTSLFLKIFNLGNLQCKKLQIILIIQGSLIYITTFEAFHSGSYSTYFSRTEVLNYDNGISDNKTKQGILTGK